MAGQLLTPQLARTLVEAAVAAPSIHNTQPWRFTVRLGAQVIELNADPARMLRRTDPRGRAVHISCGAALFNLRLAALCAGAEPVARLLPQPGDPQLLATVRLARPYQPGPRDRDLYAAIWRRHTSRAPFTGTPVPGTVLAALQEAAALEGATLRPLDQAAAGRMIELAEAAQQRLRGHPGYLAELTAWAGGPRRWDGIPQRALWHPVHSAPLLLHPAQFTGTPQLAVLATRGGTPADWLRAGQALQRVLLVATRYGIATCPLNQALEIRDPGQEDHRAAQGRHVQLVLRLGYGPPGAATPRRPVRDVIRLDHTAPTPGPVTADPAAADPAAADRPVAGVAARR